MTAQIERRATSARGEGVYTCKHFKRGDVLYTGVLDNVPILNHSHASQISRTRFGFHTGLSSIFNHSCDPNCGIVINETGAHNIVAMRSIAAGDEATYDYAMRNYRIEHFPTPCCCGTTNCRRTITGWVALPPKRKEAYAGFVAPYLIEMDSEQSVAARPTPDADQALATFREATDSL